MTTQITVTVTPDIPKGKEVPCKLVVAPPKYLVDGAIWLDPDEDYDIKLNLPAGGRTWRSVGHPFGNKPGLSCPGPTNGPTGNFTATRNSDYLITVHVAQAPGTKSVQSYRMDFDTGYFCDPIIVVGK